MSKAKPRKMTFTDLALSRLTCPNDGQEVVWDGGTKGQLGLSVLLSSGGVKSFRCTYRLHGRTMTYKIGRVGELDLGKARERVRQDRAAAADGRDPRAVQTTDMTFEQMVDEFITKRCKPRQRTWDQTERILKHNCADWLKRPVASIMKREVIALLDEAVADNKPYKATITRAWLRTMWRWAFRRDMVVSPLIDSIDLEFQKRKRDRVYSPDEIVATWRAAEQLASSQSPLERQEGAYMKLLILLAPRKTSLAALRWQHLDKDLTVWTTPFDLTKSRRSDDGERTYITPLPALAQRILKGLPRTHERAFPLLSLHQRADDILGYSSVNLRKKLVNRGAPADLGFHAWRHCVASWLKQNGHSPWERSLVLNHSASGVTEGYSHGVPFDLKLQLLQEWSDYVEGLITPHGATAVLR
jgi:integrase